MLERLSPIGYPKYHIISQMITSKIMYFKRNILFNLQWSKNMFLNIFFLKNDFWIFAGWCTYSHTQWRHGNHHVHRCRVWQENHGRNYAAHSRSGWNVRDTRWAGFPTVMCNLKKMAKKRDIGPHYFLPYPNKNILLFLSFITRKVKLSLFF